MTQHQRDWLFNVSYKLENLPRFKDGRGVGRESVVIDASELEKVTEGMRKIAEGNEIVPIREGKKRAR